MCSVFCVFDLNLFGWYVLTDFFIICYTDWIRQRNIFIYRSGNYYDIKDALDNCGFIKDEYIRNFTVNDSAIEYFMNE